MIKYKLDKPLTSYALSSSIACSALRSVTTPTVAARAVGVERVRTWETAQLLAALTHCVTRTNPCSVTRSVTNSVRRSVSRSVTRSVTGSVTGSVTRSVTHHSPRG